MKTFIVYSNLVVLVAQAVLFVAFRGGGVFCWVVQQQQLVLLPRIAAVKSRAEYDDVACNRSSFPSFSSCYLRCCMNCRSLLRLQMTTSSEEDESYEGKKIYQRTFYKISPAGGAFLSKPNALILEERLRYHPPNKEGYILPIGPRTYIFREGTTSGENEIKSTTTKELHRVDVVVPSQRDIESENHNGPGTMDDAIATALYLASNPELIQGVTMQLEASNGRSDGFEAMMAFIGAALTSSNDDGDSNDGDTKTTNTGWLFPPKVKRLILSGNGGDGSGGGGFISEASKSSSMNSVRNFVKQFPVSDEKVSLKDFRWRGTTRIRNAQNPSRGSRQNRDYYRTIIGSNIELSFPESKELAKTVANHMLPSSEYAISTLESSSTQSSSAFGAIGMDLTSESVQREKEVDEEAKVNPRIPPMYIHVYSESGYYTSENIVHLKKFLEKGYRMTVNNGGYDNRLVLESTLYDYQVLPEEAPESDFDDIDQLEIEDRKMKSYQILTAVHHPQYTPGSEEIFFPLESGEFYDGDGSFNPQIDTGSRY